MAFKLIADSRLADVADAIREKLESSDTYKVSEMPAAIRSIETEPEHYQGEYEVEPSAHEAIVLETEGLMMDDDVAVKKIYTAEVSNPQGGTTFYIASDIDYE